MIVSVRYDMGSSPRMRGARNMTGEYLPEVRIIPADAGSTCSGFQVTFHRKDHPRGCGEHSSSSPSYMVTLRIIPADAGSTGWSSCAACLALDHPRGCGEHADFSAAKESFKGSSPRMRGAPT